MKKLIHIISATLLLLTLSNTSFALTDAEAINLSGSQRMLSQRMMKSHLMIGAEVRADDAQQKLDKSVALFEERLLILQDYAPNPAIKSGLSKVEDIWFQHRQNLLKTPQKNNVPALMAENTKLLNACHQLVLTITQHANVPSADLVNISGRQRMLSQRIAKTYIAMYWGIKSDEIQKEFEDAKKQFNDALSQLMGAPTNNKEVSDALSRVASQWQFSQSGFNLDKDSGQYVPTIISVTTESILKKMDDITKLYENIMTSQQRG